MHMVNCIFQLSIEVLYGGDLNAHDAVTKKETLMLNRALILDLTSAGTCLTLSWLESNKTIF